MRARLTARQREVLLLAANGNTNARIASWLGVTSNSIAETLSVAYRRLGASDRAQAVAIALRLGLIGLDDIVLPGPMSPQQARQSGCAPVCGPNGASMPPGSLGLQNGAQSRTRARSAP